jgi:hypothetical protein
VGVVKMMMLVDCCLWLLLGVMEGLLAFDLRLLL